MGNSFNEGDENRKLTGIRKSPGGLYRLLIAAVEPSPFVVREDLRWRVRLVAGTLLIAVPLTMIGGIAMGSRVGHFPFSHFVASLALGIAYIMTRTRFAILGSVLAVVGLAVPSFFIAYENYLGNVESARHALMWLALPVVYSALVLPMGPAVVMALLWPVFVLLLPTILDCPDFYVLPIFGFLTAMAMLMGAVSYILRRSTVLLRREILEREKAEEGLREANEKLETRVADRTRELSETNETLQALVSSSPAAVIMLTHQGKVALWNPAAERIFGWTEEEILGKTNPIVPLGQEHDSDRPFGMVAQTLIHIGLEFSVQSRTGRELEVSLSTAPLHNSQGEIIGTIGVLLDITEHRQLEMQFRQAQKMEAIGRLAGGVAHDFNNLLTVINGNADILLEDISEDDANYELVEEMFEAGTRAVALVRQLLAFSRRQVLSIEKVNVNDITEGLVKMLSRLVSPKIRLELDLGAEEAVVEADKGQLEQVIMNLVVNANDAIVDSGTIRIVTRNMTSSPSISARGVQTVSSQALVLMVIDTGIGMTQEIKERVFEPFFTTKESGKGTGLGLATVYGIVSQSGWSIDVQSTMGLGATFAINMPLVSAESEMSIASDESYLPGGRESILVVEDVARVRELTAKILGRLGYRVLTAANGIEAVDVYSKEGRNIDLVLSDVMMPEMDGPTCIRHLRAQRTDLPVVFMSGRADIAVDYAATIPLIEKPFDREKLALTIRRVLDTGGVGTRRVARMTHRSSIPPMADF